MALQAFAIFDIKTGSYSTPFFMTHMAEAVRACMDLARDMSTTVGRHPSDFALHRIGEFDNSSGLLVPRQPESIGTIVSFLPQAPAMPLFDAAPDGVERLMHPRPNGRDVLEA